MTCGKRPILRNAIAGALGAALVLGATASRARAQGFSGDAPAPPSRMADAKPSILDSVGIDQKLGNAIPLDATFKDEEGRDVKLADYFGKRPVILTLVYFKCPMLCTMVLNGVVRSARTMPESVGKEFDVLTVSFDPKETPGLAKSKRQEYLSEYGRESGREGWHFLTGSEDSIKRLADAVGFRYAWDPVAGQYAHASAIMVLTPQGKVAQYLYGIDYAPADISTAVKAAAGGDTKGFDTIVTILYCFHYDPATGKYGLIISRALKVGGVLTLAMMGGTIFLLLRRERQATAAGAAAAAAADDGVGAANSSGR